ncbi:MAG: hypothetical protein K1X28_09815 [Parachlamydiales bacterium]|nr:hypothetical protein [Parachlamydiales bacterium]
MRLSALFFATFAACSIYSQATVSTSCCLPDPACCGSATIPKGFIFEGSYLYWLAKEDGLEFVQSLDQTGGFPAGINVDIVIVEPNSKWHSGFQIGGGYILSQRCQWDFFANWTSFHSSQRNFVASEDPDLSPHMLRPVWLPFIMGSEAFSGDVVWKVNFNTFDMMIGRDFYAGPWISFHPQAGVRIACIKQKYDAEYSGAYVQGNAPIPIGNTSFQASWKYDGTGIRFGSDAEWHLNSNLSIAGNAFLSAIYGKYDLRERFKGAFVVFDPAPNIVPETVNIHDQTFRVRTCIETELGIKWQQYFSCDRRRVQLGVYYDFSYWIDQNVMLNQNLSLDLQTGNSFVTNISKYGDLQLQGLRVNAELNF